MAAASAECNAEGGDDPNNGEPVAAKLNRDYRREPGGGVNIILDHHL